MQSESIDKDPAIMNKQGLFLFSIDNSRVSLAHSLPTSPPRKGLFRCAESIKT